MTAPLATGDPVRETGDILQYLVPAAAATDITFCEEKPHDKLKDFGRVTFGALGTTHFLKETTSRIDALKDITVRPDDREEEKRGERTTRKNFPSGHTTAACAPAIYHAHEYGDWKSALLMGGCLYTGYSRIHAAHSAGRWCCDFIE